MVLFFAVIVEVRLIDKVENIITELMIQYVNRFRSPAADLNDHLNEAERLFKENRYKRALDVAKDAVESVEPGSAAKIEKQFDNN